MKYIFYCIYNTQYLDGNNKKNHTPWFSALGIMLSGSVLWLLILAEIFSYLVKSQPLSLSLMNIVTAIAMLSAIHYMAFINGSKYEDIYAKYKHTGRRKTEKLIALGYFLIPAILVIVIPLYLHKML